MKKALSLLLAIVMVIGMLPMAALAAETGGQITFTTDFTNDMGVDDTFTVTATLSESPGIASFTNQFKWNEAVVEFLGFKEAYDEEEEEDVIVSDIFSSGWIVETNLNGTFTAARSKDRTKDGILYVGEFKIIAEEGALDLGLTTTEFGQKFTFAKADGTDIMPVLDFSAITGLTVGGKAPGATMPEDAPFTAITTDAGDAIEIQEEGEAEVSVWGTPHAAPLYNVVVPAGATYADITLNMPTTNLVIYNEGGAAGYYGPAAGGEGNGASFELVSSNGSSTTIRIPMEMEVTDWSGNTESFSLVKNEDGDYYVAGPEDAAFAAIAYFSFEYAEGGESEDPVEKFSITVDPALVGGTITVTDAEGNPITEAAEGETVYVTVSAAEGYSTNGAYSVNGEIANDFMFTMPAENVVLSAVFNKVDTHTCTFAEIVADEFLKSEATCSSGAVYYKSCTCGKMSDETFVSGETVDHDYVDGVCKWCEAPEVVAAPAYTVEMATAEVSVVTGETVTVPVKIAYTTEDVNKYNAFDLTFTYDAAALELTSTEINGMSVSAAGGVIKVACYGAEKDLGTALTLTFKALKPAESEVKLTAAKVDISDKALKNDAPDATILKDTTLVKVTNYTVELPEGAEGAGTAAPGAAYTFTVNKIDGYDYEVTATMGGEPVAVVANEDGSYTIEGVNGNIVISVKQTAKEYDVTLGDDLAGEDQAQYNTDYTATLTKQEGFTYQISVTIGGETYTGFNYDEKTGVVTIPGEDIKGEIVISSGKEEIPATEYSVTFQGSGAGDAEGANKVKEDTAYSFKLNKVEGYDYTVTATMGSEPIELTEADGTYTTPAATGNIVITIDKVEQSDLKVRVDEYVTLNGKTMFLVTATKTLADGEALAYEGTVMFDAAQYKAWAYLVITEGTLTVEDATAMITVVTAKHTDLTQTYDVNMTGTVDINDAQLVYDMYNNVYQDFDAATMQKFLNADVNGSYYINVEDAAAVVAQILAK